MNEFIPFNIPCALETEEHYVIDAIHRRKICGDNYYTHKCNELLENKYGANKALLTTSCSHALDMSAILCDIKPGDEVILPSFTFVSTANAFVLRGAKLVFVDIRNDTQNIDEKQIEQAITPKTKAVVPVHYAGVSCEMDYINSLAKEYSLFVVEDAAQGVNSYYKGQALGTLGDFGCYSFHETKNYTMGEGGAILIKDKKNFLRAEIAREKGTNRAEFLMGMVDKYTWVDVGSSYLPSDINAAYLYPQLLSAEEINSKRHLLWNRYYKNLSELSEKGILQLPYVPLECEHCAHMFYIKVKSLNERTQLISYLKENGVIAVFHYIPLHSSAMGMRSGTFSGKDINTTKTYETLVRLPMYYDLSEGQVDKICSYIYKFYGINR